MIKYFICVVLMITTQISHASNLFAGINYPPRAFNIGDILEKDATIGEYPIWQDDGVWQIYDLEKNYSTNLDPLGKVSLYQIENKKLVAVMEVVANLQRGRTYWDEPNCVREDMLFKVELGGGREQNCVTINHYTRFMSNPGGKGAELLYQAKEQGLAIPATVLKISITRNSTWAKKLQYSLYVNPEVVGFPAESEPNWGSSPWHKAQAFKDPKKKKFIDALSAWATSFADQMDEAIRGNPEAFKKIPSWRTAMDFK